MVVEIVPTKHQVFEIRKRDCKFVIKTGSLLKNNFIRKLKKKLYKILI